MIVHYRSTRARATRARLGLGHLVFWSCPCRRDVKTAKDFRVERPLIRFTL